MSDTKKDIGDTDADYRRKGHTHIDKKKNLRPRICKACGGAGYWGTIDTDPCINCGGEGAIYE